MDYKQQMVNKYKAALQQEERDLERQFKTTTIKTNKGVVRRNPTVTLPHKDLYEKLKTIVIEDVGYEVNSRKFQILMDLFCYFVSECWSVYNENQKYKRIKIWPVRPNDFNKQQACSQYALTDHFTAKTYVTHLQLLWKKYTIIERNSFHKIGSHAQSFRLADYWNVKDKSQWVRHSYFQPARIKRIKQELAKWSWRNTKQQMKQDENLLWLDYCNLLYSQANGIPFKSHITRFGRHYDGIVQMEADEKLALISPDNEPIIQVDIRSAHPVFLFYHLDCEDFIPLLQTPEFYEQFGGGDKKRGKRLVNTTINGKDHWNTPFRKFLRSTSEQGEFEAFDKTKQQERTKIVFELEYKWRLACVEKMRERGVVAKQEHDGFMVGQSHYPALAKIIQEVNRELFSGVLLYTSKSKDSSWEINPRQKDQLEMLLDGEVELKMPFPEPQQAPQGEEKENRMPPYQ